MSSEGEPGRERYVILGLAPPRSAWFESVSQWAMSAALGAEFVKCVSAEEVRARLAAGRRHSALLIDSAAGGFDRDLVDLAAAMSTPVIVVRSVRGPAFSGRDMGVASELAAGFGPDDLMEQLGAHCRPVGRGDGLPPLLDEDPEPMWLAPLYAVCGPGGTGASILATALAQGLATDPRHGHRVLLADLALRGDQSMLHDSPHLGPGIQELVEAHRLGRPAPLEVSRHTFDVPRRSYRLLLGLRAPEAWAALRPRSIDATLLGLRRTFQAVVADVTGDVEGESECGSVEVEERNYLARAATGRATVTVVVGAPGLKGIHSLAGLVRRLVRSGVPAERIVAVINRAPRHPRTRAESARGLLALLEGSQITLPLSAPVHVPERKLEDLLRDGAPLPAAVVQPVTRAVLALTDRLSDAAPARTGPARIAPGSLGAWADSDVDG